MYKTSDPAVPNRGSIRKKSVIRNGKEYEYWEARLTVGRTYGGKQIQKSFSGKTEAVALEKMQAVAEAVNNGTYLQASTITLPLLLILFLDRNIEWIARDVFVRRGRGRRRAFARQGR